MTAKDTATGVVVSTKGYTHIRAYSLDDHHSGAATKDLMLGDGIMTNKPGTFTTTLENLPPGKYRLTTYHNDGAGHCGNCMKVEVRGEKRVEKFLQSGNHFSREEALEKGSAVIFDQLEVAADGRLEIAITQNGGKFRAEGKCTRKCEDSYNPRAGQKCARCSRSDGHAVLNGFELETYQTTTATTATSTTVTETTHTKFKVIEAGLDKISAKMEEQIVALAKTNAALTNRIAELQGDNDALAARLEGLADELADARDTANAQADTQRGRTDMIFEAIERVVATLPSAPVAGNDNSGSSDAPAVLADGGDLMLEAGAGGAIRVQGGECAAADLCETMAAVADLIDALAKLTLERK